MLGRNKNGIKKLSVFFFSLMFMYLKPLWSHHSPHPRLFYSVPAFTSCCNCTLFGGQSLCLSFLCPLRFHGNTLNISHRTRCCRRGTHPTCQDGLSLNMMVFEDRFHLFQPSFAPAFLDISLLHPNMYFFFISGSLNVLFNLIFSELYLDI